MLDARGDGLHHIDRLGTIVFWILYTLKASPRSLSIFISFLIIASVSEGLLQRYRGRRIRNQRGIELRAPYCAVGSCSFFAAWPP